MTKKPNRHQRQKAFKETRKLKTKKRNRLIHFIRRFNERHGHIVSMGDIEEIFSQINNKNAELISYYNRGIIYKVNCRDKSIAVVVSSCKQELITTFKLKPEHYEQIEQNKKFRI